MLHRQAKDNWRFKGQYSWSHWWSTTAHNRCVIKNLADRVGWLLHGQSRQPFKWNYFPLLTGRIVLWNKKGNLRKYSDFFYLHFPKKRYLADPLHIEHTQYYPLFSTQKLNMSYDWCDHLNPHLQNFFIQSLCTWPIWLKNIEIWNICKNKFVNLRK